MRAGFGGSGLVVSLNKADKAILEEKGELECIMQRWKKPRFILHIVDEDPEQGFLEEPGFHIEAIPPDCGPEYRTQYDVYLSKERFHALVNPQEDDVTRGGYFASRSRYDRVDMNYFGI